MKKIRSNEIINYYYDFLLQSSLNSLTFNKKEGNFNKSLKDINYFLINYKSNDEKSYKENILYLFKHIKSLKNKKQYKLIFFPFVNEFIEISKNREDKIYSSPIYFIFDIDKNIKKIIVELKNIAIFHKEKYKNNLFENAQMFFNNYYASNRLYGINHTDLNNLKDELKDEEFKKKYPNNNFSYVEAVLRRYIEASNLHINADRFIDMVNKFNEALSEKINSHNFLNTLQNRNISSLIGLINIEKLIQEDKIIKGLLDCYNGTLKPYYKNINANDKLNKFLFMHPSKLIDYSNIKENETNTLILNEEKIKNLQLNHLGSFSSHFALTKSQRLSLCATLSPLEIIPVNGPPGTGKTALLRAIFADYIVKTALNALKNYEESKEDIYSLINTGKPILGTSSVRQAINNIIEGISSGFKEAKGLNNTLFKRWLLLKDFETENEKIDLVKENCVVPQIRNSENKYKDNILFTNLSVIFEYIQKLDYLDLEKEFLRNISDYLNKNMSSLKESLKYLRQKLNEKIEIINQKITKQSNFETYESLDVNERFEMFFIALHILELLFIENIKRLNRKNIDGKCPLCGGAIKNEDNFFKCENCNFKIYKNGKFKEICIENIEDLNDLLNNELSQNGKTYGLKYFEEGYEIIECKNNFSSSVNDIFLITPVFPMLTVTMHSLFGAFKCKVDGEYVLIKDFFDLVLSDESGMILVPVALPSIYIAKKMVIVGDEKQIEPVYPFDEIVDKSIIYNINKDIDYDFFKRYSAIYTNFLKKANDSTKIKTSIDDYNLWLQEHFRCKDEIIDYCNEIVYKGILIPKVRSINSKLFLDDTKYNSIYIYNVDSTVKNNSSYEEAEEIAKFLEKNIKNLTDLYNKQKNKNIRYDEFYTEIGIVTPFNNQKRLIKKVLKKINKYNFDKILIGTVHAFQGSEREIIIFSPVIDKNYLGTHFTNHDNGNMMNVAVSRAKSAFWIFGNKDGMKNAGEYTKKLVEYIEENFESHIKCPKCGGNIIEDEKVFKCENYYWDFKTKKIQGCDFVIWKNNKITDSIWSKKEIEIFLKNKNIEINNIKYKLDEKNKYFISKNIDMKICPECGNKLVLRNGKNGKFLGCSNFPKCRYTKNY